MGDSACLMHAFSYASAIPNDDKQGNPMHALGESISFGRFMSESLDWEKWSTFSHKRYVEEAKTYAKPGSVAQKKAFFEAHYKRIAAQKAAALLEQASNTTDTTNQENPISEITNDFSVNHHEHENIEGVADVEETVNEVLVEGPGTPEAIEQEPSNKVENGENQETVSGSEISETSHIEKPLLKMKSSSSKRDDDAASVTSKKRSSFSSFKASDYFNKSKVPPSPARHNIPLAVDKENNFTPITTNSTLDQKIETKPTPKSLSKMINFTAAKESKKVPPPPPPLKKDSLKVAPASGMASKKCATPLKIPMATSNDSSKVGPASGMSSKKCATPLKTLMVTSNGASNRPMTTPSSESRRIKTPVHPSASGSKTTGPKWNILSSVSKSFTAYRNKLQSPSLSTPFHLRTEERAARRKQKLEEKFNAKEVKKVQPQTTIKEKAETEFRKLRQSFCFKARPLPEFYKDRETARDPTKEAPVEHSQLPKLGRIAYSSSTQGLISKPASSSLTKNGSCKNPRKKTT